MRIYEEYSISNFQFWSGAKSTREQLTDDDMDIIENYLKDYYPNGISDTELNDFFWFNEDEIAIFLDYENWEDLLKRRDPDYDPEMDLEDYLEDEGPNFYLGYEEDSDASDDSEED